MLDGDNKFHEFAIKSILFKGRADWYFCYLKAEKIAHVLLTLQGKSSLKDAPTFQNLVHNALTLPQHIAHFAAGEMDLSMVVSDIFGLLSLVRLSGTEGGLSRDHSLIFEQEYEQLAQKMAAGNRLSPFVSAEDFSVPTLPDEDPLAREHMRLNPAGDHQLSPRRMIKDIKGHLKGHPSSKGHADVLGERMSLILDVVSKNRGISIKGISAIVKGCSEKTIQRELASLISQGLVRKEGERRWSVYLAT